MKIGIARSFASPRLTLVLLLLLAAAAAAGTFVPRGEAGSPFFRSLPFRLLLGALALDLGGCLWRRRREAAAGWRGGRALPGPRLFSWAGHLALLLTMGFALAGSLWGWTGTRNVAVGSVLESVYDWGRGGDRDLPFSVRILELRREKHPPAVKVGVRSVKDQKKLELVTTHLGEDFFLESVPGVFRLVDWDAGRRTWEFDWTRTNWGAVAVRNGEDLPGTGLELVLVAVRDFPGDRTLAASVEVVKGGEVLPRSEISPNHPLSVDGVELHLTADGVDPTGAPFVGIQAVSDPFAGAALWMGALFLLGSSGAILLKEREARG